MELLPCLIVIYIGFSVGAKGSPGGLNASEVSTMEAQCRHPMIDLQSKSFTKYFWARSPLQCPSQDVPDPFRVIGNVVFVNPGHRCKFSEIRRAGDYSFRMSKTIRTSNKFVIQKSDFAKVTCSGPNKTYTNTIAVALRTVKKLDVNTGWKYTSKHGLRVNVLLLGFDSLSRPAFIKILPKTYKYLVDHLDAIVLNNYNVVGDHTSENLSPLLTGYKLDSWFRYVTRFRYADGMPFIWKDYKRKGYITFFGEDMPKVGTFNMRLRGFRNQPTDYYMRHLYQYLPQSYGSRSMVKAYCYGNKPRHRFMLDYIKLGYKSYPQRPKFMHIFHGEMSHESLTALGVIDVDLKQTLEWLADEGHLNSTFLFLLSDHGPRFARIRRTNLGRKLHKAPIMVVVPPPWFKTKYPQLYTNLLKNAHRLTTPYDIHATLHHFLNLSRIPNQKKARSLLTEIPASRTCRQAWIPYTHCGCVNWKRINPQSPRVGINALRSINKLNQMISSRTSLCREFRLVTVTMADWVPNRGSQIQRYTLQVVTIPGPAIFEISLAVKGQTGKIYFSFDSVSRVNRYGNQSHCVSNLQDQAVDLRPFCYCKKQLKQLTDD